MFKFIGVVFIAAVFLLPFKDGSSISDAAKNEVVKQVPPALDILTARHPIKVGLIRSALNDQGDVDKFAQSYFRTQMDHEKTPGAFESYLIYYVVMFDKDDIRKSIADTLEKQLDLND